MTSRFELTTQLDIGTASGLATKNYLLGTSGLVTEASSVLLGVTIEPDVCWSDVVTTSEVRAGNDCDVTAPVDSKTEQDFGIFLCRCTCTYLYSMPIS